jgi:hypothetical protein
MDLEEEKQVIYDLLDFSDAKQSIILESIISSNLFYDKIDVASDVYKDTNIDKWCETLPSLNGSKLLINKLINNPTNDVNLLKSRQDTYCINELDFSVLQDYESDALWIYKLNEEIQDNNLIHALFPSSFVIKFINYIEPLLQFYHVYKIFLVPFNCIIYPIMSIFAPLQYMNKYFKMNMSTTAYINMLWKFGQMVFTFTGDIKTTLIKIATISMYAFLFIYNIYQTIEYAYMLYDIKSTLYKKLGNLSIFLKEAVKIISSVPRNIIKPFININTDLDVTSLDTSDQFSNLYRIWKNPLIKGKITNVLQMIYMIDIVNSITKLKSKSNWCITTYSNNTKMFNMKNPLLSNKQKANPIDLKKNVVITGPNAAGKTTYVKSILCNVILSQTLGISNAIKSETIAYDTIVSFMRISDILGSKSYFEAEAEYCLRMMNQAEYLAKNNMKGLFLMDEPMHSTPPTEGMATAFAVAEYIGTLQNTNIILTTHFHKLTKLEEVYPDKFMNLSVEAIPRKNGKGFIFPYTIKRGYSYQCIAIELLSSKHFPVSVIESAINMKNKIYSEINSR